MAIKELSQQKANIEAVANQFFTPENKRAVERLLESITTYALLVKIFNASLESPLHSIHGYQIIQEFPTQLGEKISSTTIYHLLKKFRKLSLIEQVELTSSNEHPTQKRYKITFNGEIALQLSTAQKELLSAHLDDARRNM